MGLFPHSFIADLRAQADIVQVVQDQVPLKRAGSSYRGLCPFHSEKTPSFHVNRDKGVFHCFGCGVGGDVIKFVELQDKLSFPEAVRVLAQRFGLSIPEAEDARRDAAADAEREALLKMHELANGYFREALASTAGARARRQLAERGVAEQTIETLGLGYAPPARDGLKARLLKAGFPLPLVIRSGLVAERDQGPADRFRNRLMVPICRESGSVIAFGGRSVDPDQQPKYLNSPETAIYTKGRTLYGLHVTKADIKRLGYAVVVEGYFDFAQALQGGVTPVVASCGTALTPAHAQSLKRLASKLILSFDPDAAGQGAATRSCELLVAEGFQVNVALLPPGEDPDTFVRKHGGAAYQEKLRTSRPYLEYLLDRAAAAHDVATDEGRRAFLEAMLGVAARIPDSATRDQFADRVAHKGRITEEVYRAEIRKAAAARQTTLPRRELAGVAGIRPAEKGLLWALMHEPARGLAALADLEQEDLDGLEARSILEMARSLGEWPPEVLPSALLERLNSMEAAVVQAMAAAASAPAPVAECIRTIKRLRFERDRADLQRQIDRLQELDARRHEAQIEAQIDALWHRKKALLHRIEALGAHSSVSER